MVEYEMMEMRRLAHLYVRGDLEPYLLERDIKRAAFRVGVVAPVRAWLRALGRRAEAKTGTYPAEPPSAFHGVRPR